jgi:hypothetical protein
MNGGMDDTIMTTLIPLFSHTIDEVAGATAGKVIDETHHYAWINGVHLALPTLGTAYGAAYNDNSIIISMSGTVANTTYSGLLGIWDSQNTSGTINHVGYGTPSGWRALVTGLRRLLVRGTPALV